MNDRPRLPPLDPWEPGVRGTDVPIAENGHLPENIFPEDVKDEPQSDIGTRKLTLTLITDHTGQEMRRVDMTLLELAELIRCQTAADKMSLPWLKLALFGIRRSEKNSLRTDLNTLQVSGIEGDHDSGDISFEDAVERIRKAGVRALLYTSASYIPRSKERWRILAPLSRNREPEVRAKLCARLNGLFDGKLAGESFTISQAYLYGHLRDCEHRVMVLDGKYLDHCDHTYAGSIFKDGSRIGDKPKTNGTGSHSHEHAPRAENGSPPEDWAPLIAGIMAGAPLHPSLRALAAKMVVAGMSGGAVTNALRALMESSKAKSDDPLRWQSRFNDIPRLVESAEGRFGPIEQPEVDLSEQLRKAADEAEAAKSENEKDAAEDTADDAGAGHSSSAGAAGGTSSSGPGAAPGPNPQPGGLHATPYAWTEPHKIPRRDWLYGRLLIRKFVTATIAPGGLGKSSLVAVEALAQVTGKDLLDIKPSGELRVWLINLEDPAEETTRKIQAAARHYGLTSEDIGDRLYADSGRDQEFVIAKLGQYAAPELVVPVLKAIVAEVIRREIDVLVIDPFVSSHGVAENDNVAQDKVVKAWAMVAELASCAVHLIDHTRKMGPDSEVTVESSRGAKAKTDAARVVRTLNRMTEDQGAAAGADNHRLFFRTFNDKSNLAPPADKSDWHQLRNVDLGNGIEVLGVLTDGDAVGVVVRWEWPNPLAGMTGKDFEKVAAVIRSGKWRADVRATAWVGLAVAQALGLSVQVKKDKAKIKGILQIWLAAGSIMIIERPDDHRQLRQFVEVADPEDAN